MRLEQLLNADMATLGQLIRTGALWWIDELRGLLPAGLAASRDPALLVDQGAVEPLGADRSRVGRGDRPVRAQAIVPAASALLRTVEVPAMNRRDLVRMIELDIERWLPLPAGAAVVDAAIVARGTAEGRMEAAIAALPVPVASAAISAFSGAGIAPTHLRIAGGDAPDTRFDFLPAMRTAGLAEKPRGAAPFWWAVVGFLFVLNMGMLIWRDSANVEQLQALVDAQTPAVQIARRVTRDMRQTDLLARRAVVRRRRHNALGDLALVSRTMPDGAWVQHYAWDGASLRLSGYRTADTDVAGALRRVPGFASVKSAQTEALAEISSGEPFDLAISEKPL
jgi:hypothetical protein